MAQFMLLLHGDPTVWQKMKPDQLQAAFGKYMVWGQKGREQGIVSVGNKLVDEPGRVIRGQKAVVTDGPYSETKEWLGGYYIVIADSYDAAAKLCRDHPHLEYGGTIEVRQVEEMPTSK